MNVRPKINFFIFNLSRSTLILGAVLTTVIMALVMNAILSFIWWKYISPDLLWIGTIDSAVISLLIAPMVVKLVSRLTSLEKEIASKDAVEKSERRYKLIADNIHDVVWVLDVETQKFVFVSPSIYKQTGYSFEERLNKPLHEALSKESYQLVQKVLSEKMKIYLSGGNVDSVNMELVQARKDGSENWIEITAHLIKNEENGRMEVIGVSRDINERKIAEGIIKTNELRLSRAEIVAGLGNWELDLETKNIIGSVGAQSIFGVDNSIWSESEVSNFFLPEYREKLRKDFRSILQEKSSLSDEFKIRKQNTGEIRSIYSLAQYDADKNIIYGIIQDITERKQIEAELELHREQLEKLVNIRTSEIQEVNKQLQEEIQREKEIEELLKESLAKEKEMSDLKSRFVSTTSHEFRTPLTSMLTSAEMLKRYDSIWKKEKKDEHLDKIVRSIGEMVNMLDEIISFSKADAGKTKLNKKNVKIEELCKSAINDFTANTMASTKINLDINDIDDDCYLDENIFKTIITNLLGNAIKYSPEGGNIWINIREISEYLEIQIRDEGLGIPENDIPYLFEPFYRASNTSNINGSGLGLSIVKKFVELHLGKITVNSQEGIGTEFTVLIPLFD